MDKSILIQKQIRDNAQDLHSFMSDLKSWETEMKRKESDISGITIEQEHPPVRNKVKPTNRESAQPKKPEPRILSSDYSAWEKFDVDRACEELDQEDIGLVSLDSKMSAKEKEEKIREEAQEEKEKGNKFVQVKNWDEALKCYSRAITLYNKDAIYYANRALCYLKKDELHAAESDCNNALFLNPNYIKALQRRSLACEGLGSLRRAAVDLEKILEIEPDNGPAQRQLANLRKRMGTKGPNSKSSPISTPSSEKNVIFPDGVAAEPADSDEAEVTTPEEESESSADSLLEQAAGPEPAAADLSQPSVAPKAAPKVEPTPQPTPSQVHTSQGARPRQNSETSRKDRKEGTVRPIDKPPHLRSKRPLMRVPIAEIPRGYSVTECIPLKGSADGVTKLISKHINKKFPFKSDNNYGKSADHPDHTKASHYYNPSHEDKGIHKKKSKSKHHAQQPPQPEHPLRAELQRTFGNPLPGHELPDEELARIKREVTPIEITDKSHIEAILSGLLEKSPSGDGFLVDVTGGVAELQVSKNEVYQVPKSSVQFVADWRLMRGRGRARSAYLKAIDPARLPEIFRNSLESDTLCDILRVLLRGEDFCGPNAVPSLPYLKHLSQVKRFGALAMFLTQTDKEVIAKILARSRDKEGATPEEINDMKNKYEV